VSSKCFQLYYTCSDTLLAIALPPCSFHLLSPLTVTFPKLSVILCRLYTQRVNLRMEEMIYKLVAANVLNVASFCPYTASCDVVA
jgi:hypothetical protein